MFVFFPSSAITSADLFSGNVKLVSHEAHQRRFLVTFGFSYDDIHKVVLELGLCFPILPFFLALVYNLFGCPQAFISRSGSVDATITFDVSKLCTQLGFVCGCKLNDGWVTNKHRWMNKRNPIKIEGKESK